MWIVRESEKNKNLPIFYKRFTLEKTIDKCVMEISALGIFHIKINGVDVRDYFMPGWTNYHRYVHLCSYDLTEYLQTENVLEITLADGWYSGRLGYTRTAQVYGSQNALFATLTLTYTDGTKQQIETDESWRVGQSNILKSSFLDGETVDFTAKPQRLEEELPFAKARDLAVNFQPYDYEPVQQIDELTPTVIYQDEKVLRLDFGQNFVGFISFTAQGARGGEIVVKYAEVLNQDKTLYYENLRSAEATDSIVLSGGVDDFEPRFTFHGFRYVEIALSENACVSDIKGIVLSQALTYGGKFRCSDEIINSIYRNALWGQKGNFISIPTDCPQRDERVGWTGDAQVFCNSAMFNSDCNRFFANYLRLIRTDILPDGKIPSLVPFFIPVNDSTAGVPGWADAICVIPYMHYLHYQDRKVLEENLPFAVKHFQYYLANSNEYLLQVNNPFGDWLSVECAEDIESISQVFFALSAWLISRMYALLGEEENAAKYEQEYKKIKRAFRKHFMAQDGRLTGDSQTIYAFALSVGLVTADEIKTHFMASIQRAGGKLTTGFVGVRYLLPALCQIGESDLAYQMMKGTEYPSWGYTIKQGATTIWERWNGYTEENGFETPSMNSFNHYSLGSCVEWLYSHVLGIGLQENGDVCISPVFSAELSFAEGEYLSRKGVIRVEWKRTDDVYEVTVTADDGVCFDYDFKNRQVLAVERCGNTLKAVLK